MGKAKGYYTPEQLAAIQKMVGYTPEQRAAFQKMGPTPEQLAAMQKVAAAYTPEQLAAMQKMLAKQSPEESAKLDKARKAIDRAIAIREGLIPPPWAEKLLKPASESKVKPKPATERKAKPRPEPEPEEKLGWQERRVIPILRKLWPPNGQPPANLLQKDVVEKVNDIYKPLHDGHLVSRTTIFRVINLLRTELLSRR